MSKRFVVGRRGGIAVDDGGQGKGVPAVLVHGAAGRAEHWQAVADRLRRSRRVLLPDLPGHGLSEPPLDADWSTEALAEALHLVVEELGLRSFALAGHSWGGNVVAEYAGAHPARVAALAFVEAGPWTSTAADLADLRRGFRPDAYDGFVDRWFEPLLAGARPATRDEVLRGLHAMPRLNLMALAYGAQGHDMAAAAARYPGPQLAICAEGSVMAARWPPPFEVRSVPGVSHWPQLDAPDAVAAAIEELLARARR